MKRVLAVGFIVFYTGVLTYGNACHFLRFKTSSHPLMYMIVWDMFCGWSAFDSRTHIIAEGQDEKFYDLTHAPWGEFHPYGYVGRENYDQFQAHTGTMGLNVLKHTRHEPIARLFIIEECWAKKYNLPDNLWKMRYDDPKDVFKYHRKRIAMLPDGTMTQSYTSFNEFHAHQTVMDNPRLVQQSTLGMPLFTYDPNDKPGRDFLGDAELEGNGMPAQVLSPSAPSGN